MKPFPKAGKRLGGAVSTSFSLLCLQYAWSWSVKMAQCLTYDGWFHQKCFQEHFNKFIEERNFCMTLACIRPNPLMCACVSCMPNSFICKCKCNHKLNTVEVNKKFLFHLCCMHTKHFVPYHATSTLEYITIVYPSLYIPVYVTLHENNIHWRLI